MGRENINFDIEKLHQGDNQTYKRLFDRYYHPISYTVKKILGNIQEPAEDFALFAFIQLFEQRLKIQTESHAKSFLFFTAINKAKNFIRDFRLRQIRLLEYGQITEQCDDPSSQDFNRQQAFIAIENGVQALPKEVKKVVTLFYFHNLPIKEIAVRLNLTTSSVKKYNSRGLKRLRETVTYPDAN